MQRLTFISKLRKILTKVAIYYGELDQQGVINNILGSCGRMPAVNLETFMRLNFGYKLSDFANPKNKSAQLRTDAFESMNKDGIFKVDYNLLNLACSDAFTLLGLKRHMFSPVNPEEAAQSLPKNTSTGAWWFKTPKGEYLNDAVWICNYILKHESWEYILSTTIAVVAWRTQERLSGTKFRQIFVLNYTFNIFEAMFASPVLQYYSVNTNTSYSFNSTWSNGNKQLWDKLQKYNQILSLDYSKYDLSISRGLLFYTFKQFKSCFRLNKKQDELFETLIQVHVSCPVATSAYGKPLLFQKRAGMLSGSVFTNFMDSLMNLIMICYTLRKNKHDPFNFLIKVKGDDTLIGSNIELQPSMFTRDLAQHFGANVSLDATQIFRPGEKIFFLGYLFDNKSKVALSEGLLHRKIAISGRFIKEQDMSEVTRMVSKVVSVLSNVSNGHSIFMKKYFRKLKSFYKLDELPSYYFDLSETEKQSYSLLNKKNVWHELKYGWRYK